MGWVLRVFQSVKRSLMLTLLKSKHSSTSVPLIALESIKLKKRHTSYQNYSTNFYIQDH